MGLIDKVKQQEKGKVEIASPPLTEKEAGFIIAKLRQASYQGVEFEQFYTIMTKLQEIIGKK